MGTKYRVSKQSELFPTMNRPDPTVKLVDSLSFISEKSSKLSKKIYKNIETFANVDCQISSAIDCT